MIRPTSSAVIAGNYDGLFALLVPIVCALALYRSITGFDVRVVDYNLFVVNEALFCAWFAVLPLLFLVRRHELEIRKLVPVAFWFLTATLATVMSSEPFNAVGRLRFYFSLFAFWVVVELALRQSRAEVVPLTMLVIATLHFYVLIFALAGASVALNTEPLSTPPFFANVRHFGYHGFFGACAGVAMAVSCRALRIAGFMLAVAALFGILLFGSRGAFLAWCLFAVSAVSCAAERRQMSVVIVGVLSCAVAVTAVVDHFGWFDTVSLLDRARAVPEGDRSLVMLLDRLAIWGDALSALAHRPVLGFGPEGYLISHCCNPQTAQPHNTVIQILLETGLVGAVATVWAIASLFWPTLRASMRQARHGGLTGLHAAILATLIGYGGFAMVDGVAYYGVPLLHFVVIAAVFRCTATLIGRSSPANSQ